MQLNSLKLLNFRNYDNLYIDFNKKVNLLVGKNGQGKTNIVESIYMLSFGKSFRTNIEKTCQGEIAFTDCRWVWGDGRTNQGIDEKTVKVDMSKRGKAARDGGFFVVTR